MKRTNHIAVVTFPANLIGWLMKGITLINLSTQRRIFASLTKAKNEIL